MKKKIKQTKKPQTNPNMGLVQNEVKSTKYLTSKVAFKNPDKQGKTVIDRKKD